VVPIFFYLCGVWNLDFIALHETNQDNYERLFDKLSDLVKSRPLPAIALNRIKENLCIEWTYNSNSIEGNTIFTGGN